MKILKLGSGGGAYTHNIGEAGVAISSTYEFRADEVPWLKRTRWDVDVRLVKRDGITLDEQITALETALEQVWDSAIIYESDGITATAHTLSGSRLLGGVRPVAPPSYLRFQGGEHNTYRSVKYSIEGVLGMYESQLTVIDQKETTGYVRPGATYAMIQPNAAPGVLQQTRTDQHSELVQAGYITHAAARGAIPPPLFPNPLGPPRVQVESPRKIGSGVYAAYVGFTQRYEYRFASSIDLATAPTAWI